MGRLRDASVGAGLKQARRHLKGDNMDIRAIFFDTGGTVLDWHGGLVEAFDALGARHGLTRDWHAMANDWRRRTMKGIVGQEHPDFHMDDVHRRVLDETLAHFDLAAVPAAERDDLWRTWHRLRAWPDFAPALGALRQALPVVSFTMLPTALVVDVSRPNALVWDAIVSCEMIGVYKPHRQAYLTAARWMALKPEQVLMVACHNFDLNAAMDAGMQTAFVRRPDEWGPEGPPDPMPNRAYDFIEDGFDGLQANVLKRLRPRA
jgi:2-haloacid dehalogenase